MRGQAAEEVTAEVLIKCCEDGRRESSYRALSYWSEDMLERYRVILDWLRGWKFLRMLQFNIIYEADKSDNCQPVHPRTLNFSTQSHANGVSNGISTTKPSQEAQTYISHQHLIRSFAFIRHRYLLPPQPSFSFMVSVALRLHPWSSPPMLPKKLFLAS